MDKTHQSGRNVPPISSLSESLDEDDYSVASRTVEKKQKQTNKTNLGLEFGGGVCLTHSEKKAKGRRFDRRSHRNRELSKTDQPDVTHQRKKRKKREPGSELLYKKSLRRKSSSAYEIEYELPSRVPSSVDVVVDVQPVDDGTASRHRHHDRNGRRSGEDDIQLSDTAPRRKKSKKKGLAPETSSKRSLPRKLTSATETLPGKTQSGPRRKLTFSSNVANDQNGDGVGRSLRKKTERKPRQNAKIKAAKRRKLKRNAPIALDAELSDLGEDVVLASVDEGPVYGIPISEQFMKSKPTDKLFMEYAGGFSATKKTTVERRRMLMAARRSEPAHFHSLSPPRSMMSFALDTHHLFMLFTLFCQGLFAGFALLHIIMVNNFYMEGDLHLLKQYKMLAKPLESFYYLMFSLCAIATFDRYDINRPSRECISLGLTMQTGALSTVCYFAGVVVHLAAAKTDDRISVTNTKYWEVWPSRKDRAATLRIWWILNITRGVAAIAGWALSALTPYSDRLRAHLENSKGFTA